jgi:hypothetical protein
MAIPIGASLVPFLPPDAIKTLPLALCEAIITVSELQWFG